MSIRHGWVKIFGGTYRKYKGKPEEEIYTYKGSLISWFETKWYNYRKNRLLKKSNNLSERIRKHERKKGLLKIESDTMIKEFENFK